MDQRSDYQHIQFNLVDPGEDSTFDEVGREELERPQEADLQPGGGDRVVHVLRGHITEKTLTINVYKANKANLIKTA